MTSPGVVAFIGDTHVGGGTALWPLSDLSSNPRRHVGTRYLMQCWAHFVKHCPKLDLLILTGDLIDGSQPKSKGVGVYTTDLGEQADMAAIVLEPLAAKAKKIIRVWGTPYHESNDNVLAIVDKALGITTVQQVIDIDMGKGDILNVAHHPVGNGALATIAKKEAELSLVAAQLEKLHDARWIVRAHKHGWTHLKMRRRDVVILPCWQLATSHAVKNNFWGWQPDIGGVLMLKDAQSESGYRFVPSLYANPLPTVLEYANL